MQTFAPRRSIRIVEAPPLGDVVFAPAKNTGCPEPALAQRMAVSLRNARYDTDAEALLRLRQAYPDAPLSARVAALAWLMRR
jgi:hypothetical protein